MEPHRVHRLQPGFELEPGIVHVEAVVGAVRIDHESEPHARHQPRLVHAGIESLDLHGKLPGTLAEPFRHGVDAFRQDVSEPFPVNDLPQACQHRPGVSPGHLDAVGLVRRQQAALPRFHAESYRPARRYGIDGGRVTHLVSFDHGFEVIDTKVAAERAQRLVFRSPVGGIDGVIGTVELGPFLAPERAGETAFHPIADGIPQRYRGNIFDLGEFAVTPVADRHVPVQHADVHVEAGAGLLPGLENRDLVYGGDQALVQFPQLLRINHGYLAGTAHGYGLEFLGTHDRAHAAAAGSIVEAAHDAAVPDQVFRAGTDEGHPHLLIAEFLADRRLSLAGFQSPEMPGVADLHLAVVDIEPDGLVRGSFDDNNIEPGPLEFRSPEFPHLGKGDPSGQRRLGPDGMPSAPHERGPGHRTGRDDQLVLRSQGVDAGLQFLPEIIGDKS